MYHIKFISLFMINPCNPNGWLVFIQLKYIDLKIKPKYFCECMMFADDIVISSGSREQVEKKLQRWRYDLERRGMKVSRSKTEYMCVNEKTPSGTIRQQGAEQKKVEDFKYAGSTLFRAMGSVEKR